MSNFVKYALVGTAGYALHAVLTRDKTESKVYTPTPLDQGKLSYKIMDTVTSHIISKVIGEPSSSRYGRTYSGGTK
jgi:hypothetical protein